MSARDDYPLYKGWGVEPATYNAMCDEIDRLRIKVEADDSLFKAMEAPLDELVRELTVHADAMSGAIKMICSATDDELDLLIVEADGCAEAYDEFVKEC